MTPHTSQHRWAGESAPFYLIEAPLVVAYSPRTRARSVVTSWRWVTVGILDDPQHIGAPHSGVRPLD